MIQMARPYKCPYCGQNRNTAKGFRQNRDGKVRLRRCKACGRRWTVRQSLIPFDEAMQDANSLGGEAEDGQQTLATAAGFVDADQLVASRKGQSSRYDRRDEPEL